MTQHVDCLLVGGTVVTMNKEYDIFVQGAVAIAGDSIVAVGEMEEVTAVYTAAETLDLCVLRLSITT